MGYHYIPRSGKKKKRKSRCRYCKDPIMWAVNPFGKNIPIEYDEKLESLYDGIAKVYFIPGKMIPHFDVCKYSKQIKQIY